MRAAHLFRTRPRPLSRTIRVAANHRPSAGNMKSKRKLLSIAHSYAVALNRRLAHELARAGGEQWEVTAVAPSYFHGGRDLRPVWFEAIPDEPLRVEVVPARMTRFVHFFTYGPELGEIVSRGWDLVHAWEEPFIFAGRQIAHLVPQHT